MRQNEKFHNGKNDCSFKHWPKFKQSSVWINARCNFNYACFDFSVWKTLDAQNSKLRTVQISNSWNFWAFILEPLAYVISILNVYIYSNVRPRCFKYLRTLSFVIQVFWSSEQLKRKKLKINNVIHNFFSVLHGNMRVFSCQSLIAALAVLPRFPSFFCWLSVLKLNFFQTFLHNFQAKEFFFNFSVPKPTNNLTHAVTCQLSQIFYTVKWGRLEHKWRRQ